MYSIILSAAESIWSTAVLSTIGDKMYWTLEGTKKKKRVMHYRLVNFGPISACVVGVVSVCRRLSTCH